MFQRYADYEKEQDRISKAQMPTTTTTLVLPNYALFRRSAPSLTHEQLLNINPKMLSNREIADAWIANDKLIGLASGEQAGNMYFGAQKATGDDYPYIVRIIFDT